MDRRRFFLALLGIAVVATPTLAAPRPVVLLFPISQGKIATVSQNNAPSADGLSDGERITLAARAVRQQFDAENVVETLLYQGDDIYFQRAHETAKVTIAPGTEPTDEQRIKIGAAVGANYVVTVFSQIAGGATSDKGVPVAPTLEMELVEVKAGGKAGRRFKDHVAIGASGGTIGRRPLGTIPDSLASAARTLVLRFLAGPLREYRIAAVDPKLLPPPPRDEEPAPVTSPLAAVAAVDPEREMAELCNRAKEQIEHGQLPAAIQLYRQAVNLAPRSLTPRVALVQTYLADKRPTAAITELRRIPLVVTTLTAEQRSELNRLLSQAFMAEGDQDGATGVLTEVLKNDPKNSEARLGLAEILLSRGENDAAEIQYRIIRRNDPSNRPAAQGLARLLALKSDIDGAQKEAEASSPDARNLLATVVFVEAANALAARVVQNRTAWEENKLSREIFYKATVTQSALIAKLASLLSSSPAPEAASEVVRRAHNRRVLAANLLSQALASLQGYLETGEVAAGTRARTLINEYFIEMKDAESGKR